MTRNLRAEARDLIRTRIGFVVPSHYDERIDLALKRAAHVLDLADTPAALPALEHLPFQSTAWQQVIASVTIGETNFFRHAAWFGHIERHVLTPIVAARRDGSRRLDIWSAGCASGEEAYTLALIVDRLIPDRRDWHIRILGTDINAASLARARQAIYGRWTLREVDAATSAEHFTEIARDRFELAPAIRAMVTFGTLNLAADLFPDPARGLADFDLIICRNVLMYLAHECQSATALGLAGALAPEGWLAVSPAEAVAEWYRPLTPINLPGAIFFRRQPDNPGQARAAKSISAKSGSVGETGATATGAAKKRRGSGRQRPCSAVREPPPAARPRAKRDVLREIRTLADCGELHEARRRCEAAIVAAGHDHDVNLLLATICMEMGELTPAFEAARRAAYLAPDSAAAHFVVGTILFRLGSAEAALRSMAVVLRLLQAKPAEATVASHFDATVGALREAAETYLAGTPTFKGRRAHVTAH